MKRSVLTAMLLATLGGCQRDPSYTLPSGSAPVAVQLVQTTPGTVDIGGDATELCVLQSIAQFGSAAAPSATSGDASDAETASDDDDAGDGAPGLVAQVDLYFDTTTGTWHLASNGPVSATVACAPWSAFGGPEALTRFDNGGGSVYTFGGYTSPTPAQTVTTDGQSQCFLSGIEGDFGADGNGAMVDDASLSVANPGLAGDAIYASATCFSGTQPVAFRDFVVDSVAGALSVPVTPADQGLCGLSALGSLTQSGSSLIVTGGRAIAFHAYGVVRCFLFDLAGASDARP